ncbi:MAG: hypothetical protein DRI37_02395 [Chloroflexi bacterium]|nr:MAG: hypothetical protein DRI37_02395 [Chloroflexota bacterium]
MGILLLPFVPRFLRLVDTHGWLLTINLALLISLPLSPYGFAFDQVVLVPAAVQLVAWVWLGKVKSPWSRFVVAGLIAVYGLALWLTILHGVAYHWFAWIPFALAWLYGMALNNLQTSFD